jgi:uncharacterized protein
MRPSQRHNKIVISTGYKIFLVAFLLSLAGLKLWQYHWPQATIDIANQTLIVDVAKTPWHWKRGLGKRHTFGNIDGMIFVFPTYKQHGIVMRDMRFPIDIVWLDNQQVVDIAPNVQPEPGVDYADLIVYKPRVEANGVIELPAGWVERQALRIGDTVRVLRE